MIDETLLKQRYKEKQRVQVKTVTIARTINLGNYNSLRLELAADIDEGEKVSDVTEKLNNFIIKEAARLAKTEVKV